MRVVFLAAHFLWLVVGADAGDVPARAGFLRGMTVSCQTYGNEWSTPEMRRALIDLKGIGVTSVAIHPYARITASGTLVWSRERDENVLLPGAWCDELGLKLFVVPHIAYWGSPWLWRGEIDFPDAKGWNRFFDAYEAWILHEAKLAERAGAELFSVGLEYGPSQKFEQRWRRIIAKVRTVYSGQLTYGANWNEVENVSWWDALDYNGVLAYFPLSKGADPDEKELARGWNSWRAKLDALSEKHSKPILFTEVGYHENSRAAAEPWDFHRTGGPQAREVQVRCIKVATRLEQDWPNLAGMFWWKWFPALPDREVQTFDLRTPWAREAIRSAWQP